MAEFVGNPSGAGRRFAIACSRFNQEIVEKLLDGALETLVDKGVSLDDIDVVWVPGAWELPMAVRRLLATDRYQGIVAVGAVIRGDTPHFEYVAGECARGLATASAEFDIPIGFGVLTTDNDAQAEARAGGDMGNKGHEAAMAVLEMADLFDRLDVANEG
jgi:6,7-dimethyl-8-ribityllumazine synthase